MRTVKPKTQKSRKEIPYESDSFKGGKFKKDELTQYGLSDEEISVILDYQTLLPILQVEDNNVISAKELYSQLKVSRDFSTWIKQQIEELELFEEQDYFICAPLKGSGLIDYNLTIIAAKEIAMVAGSKGGRTSKELKERSKLVRRYFIIIEKAFTNRTKWNSCRKNTLINCKELRGALIAKREELLNGVPEWITIGNIYSIEFSLLNTVILGMSAKQYRRKNNIPEHEPIRNYFTNDQLDDVERLERYDAQLIISQEIYSYNERMQILQTEYNRVKYRKSKYV